MATINSINNISNPLASTLVTIDPGASGDSTIQFNINTVSKFKVGIDDDDSDAYKISIGSALGTNDAFTINNSNGDINLPLQPSCLISGSANKTSVTGDGTIYQIAGFNTSIFDQNSDFNTGTSIFTAPITGKYLINATICLGLSTAAHTTGNHIDIVTSNRTYTFYKYNYSAVRALASNSLFKSITVIADLDVSDTAYITVTVGGASKTVDVIFNSTGSYFSSQLIA